MPNSQDLFRRVVLALVVAATGILGSPALARAGNMGALVPAYFYPGTGGPGGVGDGWAALAAAAAEIPITAVFNPNSGPLPGPPDLNYVNAMTNLENAGGHVIAYIFTDFGNVPESTVLSEVSTYVGQYGSLINGFFLDAMSTDLAKVSYYTALFSDIKSLNPSYQVVGNPGTNTIPDYLQAADTLVTHENDNAVVPYLTYQPPSWVFGFPRSRFANIVYNQPNATGADSMVTDVNLAYFRNNIGSIYVTDQTLPNPYSQLPSYWNQEVAAIASVPEPGAFGLLVSGCLLSTLAVAARRRDGK
jgi:hypothetical protein